MYIILSGQCGVYLESKRLFDDGCVTTLN